MACPGCAAPLETRRLDDGIDVDFCPSCYGVWYDVADLAVDLPLDDPKGSGRACPRDGGGLLAGKVSGTGVVADRCPTCGGVWLDAGEVQKLRKELGVDNLVGKGAPQGAPPPLPSRGSSSAKPSPSGGRDRREAERSARRVEPRDCGAEANPDETYSPTVSYQERVYQHFQTSWPKVTFVLGEFPWRVQVGDEAKTRDFIHPPFLISEEVTKEDRTWSHGVYLEPSEVWSGFGLEGAPPQTRGTAPAQRNPHREAWGSVGLWGGVATAAALALFIFFSAAAKRRAVYTGTFAADPAAVSAGAVGGNPDAAPNAVVTPEFDLSGARPASVRIHTVTNVENSWLFLRMALVNAETDTATHFEREVSYYHGVDDGESWSEGSRSDTVYLSSVRPGRYYLLIDPEFDKGASYSVEVTWDQPRILHLFLATALLLIPFGWVYAMMRSFEVGRWAESDHPMTQVTDDEDE